MFFFIGGVQPKTVTVDPTPRLCPACGLAQAKLKRIDHYLSIFFIPIFPVKRGEPVLICERCNAVSSPEGDMGRPGRIIEPPRCTQCGAPLDASFRYCPSCGSRV